MLVPVSMFGDPARRQRRDGLDILGLRKARDELLDDLRERVPPCTGSSWRPPRPARLRPVWSCIEQIAGGSTQLIPEARPRGDQQDRGVGGEIRGGGRDQRAVKGRAVERDDSAQVVGVASRGDITGGTYTRPPPSERPT